MIERPLYLDKIMPFVDTPFVKILTGVRRCGKSTILKMIIKKLREDGATILYTTHYMEEVEILCDRIIILDKGKIIAQGTNEELKDLAKIEEKITKLKALELYDSGKINTVEVGNIPTPFFPSVSPNNCFNHSEK